MQQNISRYKVAFVAKLIIYLVLAGLAAGPLIVLFIEPSGERALTMALFLAFDAIVYSFFYFYVERPLANFRRLQTDGISATALIKEARFEIHGKLFGTIPYQRGAVFNNQAKVTLLLELKNKIGWQYTAKSWVLVPRGVGEGPYRAEFDSLNTPFKAGMEIPVRIDPADESNVVLDIGKFTF